MTDTHTTAAAEKIWAGLVEGAEGGTFTTDGEALPTTGYVVGGVSNSLINPRTFEEVHAYCLRLAHAGLLGFWLDKITGNYHIDGCTWHVNRANALGVARRRGELAIFDVIAGAELPVSY